jgi:hypothetical protein
MGIAVVFDYPGGGIEQEMGFATRDEAIGFARAKAFRPDLMATVVETGKNADGTIAVLWWTWFRDGVEEGVRKSVAQ